MKTFNEIWTLLITQDESTQIEVKRGSEVGRSCLETISSFSNEVGLGGGYLVLGIAECQDNSIEKYEVVGVEDSDRIQRDILSVCNDETFNIRLRPTISLETVDTRTVIVVYIPEAKPTDKPVYLTKYGLPRGAYRRIGSADVRCNENDLALFYQEHQSKSYDTTPLKEAVFDDLDDRAIEAYRQLRTQANPDASELTLNDRDLLYAIDAISRHPDNPEIDCPTVAGLILFGKTSALRRYFPMHRIDYMIIGGTEWIGDPEERYKALNEIREPLLVAIPKLTALVIGDLPKSFHLQENQLQRQDIPLVPSKVIREAIVNAVMHRNYRVSSPIQILRYSDRLEIHNAGYSLKPTEQIDQPGSYLRNSAIASVLHELNIAETKGTGAKAIIEAMLEANLSLPRFESQREEDHFCLTLLTHHLLGKEDTDWLKQFRRFNLSHDEARALTILRRTGELNNLVYRLANNVDTLTASKNLARLKKAGILNAYGKGRSTCYRFTPQFDRSGEYAARDRGSSTTEDILPGEYAARNRESSATEDILPGEYVTSKSESSTTELNEAVESSGREIPDKLQIRLDNLPERGKSKDIEALIVELCKLRPRSSSELAELLKRSQKYLLEQYLKPLIDRSLLEYTNPDSPNDPYQTYRVLQKQNE